MNPAVQAAVPPLSLSGCHSKRDDSDLGGSGDDSDDEEDPDDDFPWWDD